jgi:uncharacterized protein DUF6585
MPSGDRLAEGSEPKFIGGLDLSFAERRYRKSYNIRVAIAALTFSLLYLLWFVAGEPELAPHTMFFWTCVTAAVIYAAIFVVIEQTVLTVSDQGIRHESIFAAEEIRWEEVSETRYRARPSKPRMPMGLFAYIVAVIRKPRRVKLRLIVQTSDGRQIKITTSYRHAREAISIILGQILPRMTASVRARVESGQTVTFGQLTLSGTAATWKSRTPIPLADITRAEIVGRNLQLKCSGRWTSALKVRSDSIPNVLVFLEVLEAIAPRLRPTRIDPLARVRL